LGVRGMEKVAGGGARVSRMGLYGGDAMATMIAVGARRAGRPVKLALDMAAAAANGTSAAQLAQAGGYSPELVNAPAVVREELALPYVAGLALVAEGHRRGGVAPGGKKFEHPPTRTHHVQHPGACVSR